MKLIETIHFFEKVINSNIIIGIDKHILKKNYINSQGVVT